MENINIEKLKELLNSGIYNEMYFEDAMRNRKASRMMKNYIANIRNRESTKKGSFAKTRGGETIVFTAFKVYLLISESKCVEITLILTLNVATQLVWRYYAES